MNSPSRLLPGLDDDVAKTILLRLPIKTLMQIKRVLKSWKTLISENPSFAKLHLQRSPRNTHLLLLPEWNITDDEDDEEDQNLDCSVVPFPVSDLLENPINITIPKDPYYQLKNRGCFQMVGSCNGLICLRNSTSQSTCFRLWNPATRSLSEEVGHIANFHRFAFGYDISAETYKVVGLYDNDDLFGKKKNHVNNVKLFSFGDNRWRKIESFPCVPFGGDSLTPVPNNGVYVSGSINWLAIRNTIEYKWRDITVDQFVIISLDLATERHRELPPPRGFDKVPPIHPSVSVLMDSLCFSHRFEETHFVLWKMMDFGVQESWTQFLRISFQDLQIDYGISNELGYYSQLSLFPLCVFESRNKLIMASNQNGNDISLKEHAIIYNWRDNVVEQITSDNKILWFYTKDYVESLVSTCQMTTPSTSSTSGVING